MLGNFIGILSAIFKLLSIEILSLFGFSFSSAESFVFPIIKNFSNDFLSLLLLSKMILCFCNFVSFFLKILV